MAASRTSASGLLPFALACEMALWTLAGFKLTSVASSAMACSGLFRRFAIMRLLNKSEMMIARMRKELSHVSSASHMEKLLGRAMRVPYMRRYLDYREHGVKKTRIRAPTWRIWREMFLSKRVREGPNK